jgi:hypothetical protein
MTARKKYAEYGRELYSQQPSSMTLCDMHGKDEVGCT